jgi:uncharacterized membrane protein YbaN (DUF454 family)
MREAAGVGLLVVGVLGCLLPVMPGIPFLVAGAGLLGANHPLIRRSRAWMERKGWRHPDVPPDDSPPQK